MISKCNQNWKFFEFYGNIKPEEPVTDPFACKNWKTPSNSNSYILHQKLETEATS